MWSVMKYYSIHSSSAEFMFPIMGVLLATSELSSGFMKNVYKQIKPSLFILSKFITLLAYVLLFMILDFILLFLANVAFGAEETLISSSEYPFSIGYLLTICLYYVVSGSIGMAVGSLFKKEYIAIGIVLSWMLTYHMIYPLIGELVMFINPAVMVEPGYSYADVSTIYRYLHFGANYNFVIDYIRGVGVHPTTIPIWIKKFNTFFVREFIYILVCYLICWLTLRRRRV